MSPCRLRRRATRSLRYEKGGPEITPTIQDAQNRRGSITHTQRNNNTPFKPEHTQTWAKVIAAHAPLRKIGQVPASRLNALDIAKRPLVSGFPAIKS